ncbi:unnamed protein product [Rotaria sordida]|uniref:Uncharacterized protein n=2 Tax=Rotaria sordida TaxID=392033 RepID=A0A819T2A5_9BILA|nr:unnamed protein product [Rotaria sordida]
MSGESQEQHQLVVPNDDSSQTCKSDDQYQQFLIESSNDAMRTSLTTNENEVNNYNQQLRIRDVKIVLFDCMKCYVRIPRCKTFQIEQQVYDSNSHTQTNVGREIQEYREEQEIALQKQDNQATSEIVEEKEEENDGFIDYLDDYNPMNTLIIIDLPWPQATE